MVKDIHNNNDDLNVCLVSFNPYKMAYEFSIPAWVIDEQLEAGQQVVEIKVFHNQVRAPRDDIVSHILQSNPYG